MKLDSCVAVRRLALAILVLTAAPAVRPQQSPENAPEEAALQAAKLAEEGDHDLERATKEYQAVVSRFDSLRPQAAEALFRLAEVATKLGDQERAQSLHTRITTEFADLNDLATRSREHLAASGLAPWGSMPPDLVRHYGIVRDPARISRYTMSPEMMTRGLLPGGGLGTPVPMTETDPGDDPHRLAETPSAVAGQRQSLTPPTLLQSPPPVAVNLTGGRLDALATLRGEAAQVSAQLRKVRRELQAISIEDPDSFPASLIEDTETLTLLKGYDGARKQADSLKENTPQEFRERFAKTMNYQRSQFLRGLEIHRSRLESAQRILTDELAALENEIRKATPKF